MESAPIHPSLKRVEGVAPSAGSPTAIDEVPNDKSSHGDWFDISGRRVEHPTKGLYIKDGHKVLVN